MDNILAIALTSMHQDLNRLDRVAQNLANAMTPGYKREVVAGQPFGAHIQSLTSDESLKANFPETQMLQVKWDIHPGTLKLTGEPLDVALTGDGFFEVQMPYGLAYTRKGDFHVDGSGRVVTAQGHPVMGIRGDIHLTTHTPRIDAYGNITEPDAIKGPAALGPGDPVAQIKVVHFQDPQTMQRLGDGLMTPGTDMSVAEGTELLMRQGALENSNISSMHEMVQLIQASRHFESMQKVVQGYDEILGTAIRKLGEM